MSDVNHQISKTLTEKYGAGTLFVLEDLKGVSFDEKNLSHRSLTYFRRAYLGGIKKRALSIARRCIRSPMYLGTHAKAQSGSIFQMT